MSRNLKGVFGNNENKVIPYCVYWDLKVNAVIGLDGKLQLSDNDKKGQRCAIFFLSEDEIYENVIVKSMKMSNFIEKAKAEGADYIDLCNTSQTRVSRYKLDRIDRFEKEILDQYLDSDDYKDNSYSFLYEDGLLVKEDSDKNTLSETTLNQIMKTEIHHTIDSILEKAGVETINELFELVNIGKKKMTI